jgi:hypothetical protein
MQSTRRQFFRQAATVGFCTLLPFPGVAQSHNFAAPPESKSEVPDPLAGVTAETFEAWIGSQFRATLNHQPVGTLTLLSVSRFEPRTGTFPAVKVLTSPAITSFTLRFSKAGAPLAQETYTLEHDWLGTFPLLLVPSGARTAPATCTAVFTLLQ